MISWRLEIFGALASTSDTCIQRAKSGAAEGLAVLALRQTAGRGSRGRTWTAMPGNLNLSVLLRPRTPAAEINLFPLLAGVAVADAVSAFLPDNATPVLKWPNDVLLGGGKLAGILIDAEARASRLDWLVIGIGINLQHAPEIPGRRTTTLSAHGGETTPQAIADVLLDALGLWLERSREAGHAVILAEWQRRAHPPGTELTVQRDSNALTGRFAGLSEHGELLLEVENRIERLRTGEILLGS